MKARVPDRTGARQSSSDSASRLRTGSEAEQAVARWLQQRGYAIVAMNLRVGHLEIDIVARQDSVIVIVEVRSRGPGAWTTPFGSVGGVKRARLRRAGERLWQRRYRHDASVERLRYDVASVRFVAGEPEIEYAVAAF